MTKPYWKMLKLNNRLGTVIGLIWYQIDSFCFFYHYILAKSFCLHDLISKEEENICAHNECQCITCLSLWKLHSQLSLMFGLYGKLAFVTKFFDEKLNSSNTSDTSNKILKLLSKTFSGSRKLVVTDWLWLLFCFIMYS